MAWLILIVAGILEIGWALGLKYTQGFTKPLPTVLTIGSMVASMVLLAQATKTLPIGTAYAVWVGIGALGAAIGGLILFDEVMSLQKGLFLGMLLVAIIGLKMSTG